VISWHHFHSWFLSKLGQSLEQVTFVHLALQHFLAVVDLDQELGLPNAAGVGDVQSVEFGFQFHGNMARSMAGLSQAVQAMVEWGASLVVVIMEFLFSKAPPERQSSAPVMRVC
jgi:hypothetical protein